LVVCIVAYSLVLEQPFDVKARVLLALFIVFFVDDGLLRCELECSNLLLLLLDVCVEVVVVVAAAVVPVVAAAAAVVVVVVVVMVVVVGVVAVVVQMVVVAGGGGGGEAPDKLRPPQSDSVSECQRDRMGDTTHPPCSCCSPLSNFRRWSIAAKNWFRKASCGTEGTEDELG
jgi:hypothetical protein